MLKDLNKQEGWNAVNAIVHENHVEASFHCPQIQFCCPSAVQSSKHT